MSSSNQINSRHSLPVNNNCYPAIDQSQCRARHQVYNSLQDHNLRHYYQHPNNLNHQPGLPLNLPHHHHHHQLISQQNHHEHQTTIAEHQYSTMTQQVTNPNHNHLINNMNNIHHHDHNNMQNNHNHLHPNQHLVQHRHQTQIRSQLNPHIIVPPRQPQQNLPPLPPHPNHQINNSNNNNHSHIRNPNNDDHDNPRHDPYTEQVIAAILKAKDAMEKPIEERDENDILLIDYLCSLVHGFDVFPKTIRRALAAQAVLIVIEERGKELIVHSEELDSFCVLIFGECVQLDATKSLPIRYYHIGDAFGVCEPTTETIRFVGNMITKSDNCAFLCVKRDDFYTILTDPANYPNKEIIRHREPNGTVVCVSQLNIDKKSSTSLWSHHMQSSNPFKLPDGHMIVKANESCLLMSLVDGYDRIDQDYVDDFLLLFRVFMTEDSREVKKLPPGMIKLCLTLKHWLNHNEFRDKIVKIMLEWLSSYYFDFELDTEFSYLFMKEFASRLKDLGMNNHLQLLHATLTAKSKIRNVSISRPSKNQPLSFSIGGSNTENWGIFITDSSYSRTPPYDNLTNYLNYLNHCVGSSDVPPIPPRNKTNQVNFTNQENRISVVIRPGDQILEVNKVNFSSIRLEDADSFLKKQDYLSLTVKYNPSAYHELMMHRDGRKKPSMPSPYPIGGPNRFTFNLNEQHNNNVNHNNGNQIIKSIEQPPPPSPLFSNANFGFKSIIKDKSRISSIISSSKHFVKQQFARESSLNSANLDTMSRASDNISDDHSNNELDMGKTKSNPELTSLRTKELGVNNVTRFDNLSVASMTENSNYCSSLVNVLRVFNATNNDSRYILINEESSAREVVTASLKDFNLTNSLNSAAVSQPSPNPDNNNMNQKLCFSSQDWYLYEVSYDPESKTVKKQLIPDQTNRLAERSTLCSRFYIKNNSSNNIGPSKLDMETDNLRDEILKESPPSINLASLNATLLAVELTLSDFDKFKNIEPQQFVYDTFFNYSECPKTKGNSANVANADNASLKSSSSESQDSNSLLSVLNKSRQIPKGWMKEYREFADISNKEMFWVVCEILSERNISRRVKIIKQFIRVADVCSQLRNFNSMFAIISGLGNSCVSRLKRTFEKLKPKYKNQLEKMRALFDPSRNMSNYRICLQQTPPPAIPLFPQIKKDLTFTKEGRSIFVLESNELSDDDDEDAESGFGYSQDTVRRRAPKINNNNMKQHQENVDNLNQTNQTKQMMTTDEQQHHQLDGSHTILTPPQQRQQLTSSYYQQQDHQHKHPIAPKPETILINFAEIRKFTERVRNVTHFSSTPYSNDLLTNTKDIQRSQAQIRRMHEEWQMRKRIRHYLAHTLDATVTNNQCTNNNNTNHHKSVESMGGEDQVDSSSTNGSSLMNSNNATKNLKFNLNGRLCISYDERSLYQRSLEVEPELNQASNNRIIMTNLPSRSTSSILSLQTNNNNNHQLTNMSNQQQPQTALNHQLPLPIPPLELNMQPPFVLTNQSPTLSKSSSLSSSSSFIQQNPVSQLSSARNNHNLMSSSVGKFGTESTESLRKLQALSENMDAWRPFPQAPNGNESSNQTNRPKALSSSRMFPGKGSR